MPKKRKIKENKNEKKEKQTNDKKRNRERNTDDKKLYRFIGESSRLTTERGKEHKNDLKYRRTRSHMLSHCEEVYTDENPDEIEFGMRILWSYRRAF